MVNSTLRHSIRFALATAASLSAMQTANAQNQNAKDDETNSGIDEVVVTGSRIRRVDSETASPVLVIDQAAIQKSGVTTAGDLLSRLPTVSGAAINPAVNNGGGFGEANIELRGLDAKRTLVLLNGRRLGLVGTSDATDINLIPVNLLERVDVLKEGAGAIYGSDAIAGVVNFVTRKDVDALEITGTFGQTSRKDGEYRGANVLWGSSGDRYHFTINGSFSKQDQIGAGDRDFSKFALYLYSGSVQKGGSSRTPTGRIFVPGAAPIATALQGCGSVTRVGAGTSQADYRCFAGAPDRYNYQPFNLVLTPQDRTSVFSTADFQINDAVQAYGELLFNHSESGYEIAPLPFDAVADDVVISAQSLYNPFGISFGGLTTGNPNLLMRLESLGDRQSDSESEAKVFKAGLRGAIGETGWNWDLMGGFSHLNQDAKVFGYLVQSKLAAAFGPSFLNGGVPTCGTPMAPIPLSQCTPVNIFNLQDPAQISALETISTGYHTVREYTSKQANFAVDGKLFSMPAGDVLSSFELNWFDQEGDFRVDDSIVAQPPLYIKCALANETCSGNSSGRYNVKEVSAEIFLPLVADKPGVEALNVTLGSRFSDYSLFGSTTNSTVKLEYRPIKDILVRGTFAEVFRAPTITDLSASPASNSATFADPCKQVTTAKIAANPNLGIFCAGVVPNGTFAQANGQVTGILLSNPDLDPETGDVTTFGVLWQPGFLDGFQVELNYWKYKIDGVITQLDTTFMADQCVATGDPLFCSQVTRFTSGANQGQVFSFKQPTVNLGSLETDGIDFGLRYALTGTGAGDFNFQLDATHINSYENSPGGVADPVEVAGTYNRQFGNYGKNRGTLSVGWAKSKFDAQVTARYIDSMVLLNPDGANPTPNPSLPIDAITYLDLYLGYKVTDGLSVQLFGTNLTDEQPPILYQNNVTNANTDVQTYDTLGRRYSLSATFKF